MLTRRNHTKAEAARGNVSACRHVSASAFAKRADTPTRFLGSLRPLIEVLSRFEDLIDMVLGPKT